MSNAVLDAVFNTAIICIIIGFILGALAAQPDKIGDK